MNKFSIAVFGCWNEGCKNNSGQKAVSEMIKSKESNYKFMVILGDNYYAEKINLIVSNESKLKIKLTNIQELKDGFECLKNINLEKKLIMGNHDVEDSFDKSCSVLKAQLKLPWYDIKFPFGYDMYYLNGNENNETILFIYLDTTLYSKKISDTNSCYGSTLNKNIEDLRNEQNNFIVKTLEITENILLNIKNVVFFGHEPLLIFKEKKDKQEPSINKELLQILFKNKKSHINFYWICADYHIYQNSIITNENNNQKIFQWIFGTGGGELDKPVKTKFIKIDNYNLNIEKNIVIDSNGNDISKCFETDFGIDKFGYGEITFNLSSLITHKFIMNNYTVLEKKNIEKRTEIIIKNDENDKNEFKKKYIKYKTKYTNLVKKLNN
jgi:hypothetical protein